MSETNGNGNGAKLPLLPLLIAIMTGAIGAFSTWALKLDERVFSLSRDAPTRAEIQTLRTDLTSRLDRIDANVSALLAAPSVTASRPYTRPER